MQLGKYTSNTSNINAKDRKITDGLNNPTYQLDITEIYKTSGSVVGIISLFLPLSTNEIHTHKKT